jgi:hypothetical protein
MYDIPMLNLLPLFILPYIEYTPSYVKNRDDHLTIA